MSIVLVTGGAGFIGSNLVEELLGRGHDVRVIDNFISGRLDNLVSCVDRITLHDADICEDEPLAEAMDGVEIVFHLAAVTSVPQSVEAPVDTVRTNIEGTMRVLDCARHHGVRLVVFASSSAVYGNPETLPLAEDAGPNPLSPYAVTKLSGEHCCRMFSSLFGLQTLSLRFFNVYGPKQDPDSHYAAVVPRFIFTCLAGKQSVIFGDGRQTRDFIFVGDVARLCCALVEGELEFRGEVVNISTGTGLSINELARVVRSLAGGGEPVYGPPRPGDIQHSVADISRARQLLGFKPEIDLETGLKNTVEWFTSLSTHSC